MVSAPPTAEAATPTTPLTRALAGTIFAALAVSIFATFGDYGISWDENIQNIYGEKILAYYTSGLEDTSAFSFQNLYLYGGFFDLLAAIANLVSPFGTFETRHLLGGLFFMAGLVGAWKLTRLLAGPRAALIALACLATTPLLYGHAFINPKDSPFAWLGIWTTYFACRLLGDAGRPPLAVLAGFGLTVGLIVGTRIIGVLYPATFAGIVVVAAIARHLKGEPLAAAVQAVKDNALPYAGAAVLGFLIMALVWPWSVQNPLNLVTGFHAFAHFVFTPWVLWNGALFRADLIPWTYLPGLIVMQLPEHVLGGLVIAIGACALNARRIVAGLAEPQVQRYLFVVGTMLVPMAAYLYFKPADFNGLRHFLFLIPPLVILGAIGIDQLLTWAGPKSRATAAMLSLYVVTSLAHHVVLLVSLHPYQYVSYNSLIGGIGGAQNRFELDYWGTTLAESARGLGAYLAANPQAGTGNPARVFACGDRTSTGPFLPPGTELTEVLDEADFYIGMTGVPCQDPADRPGRLIFEVTRRGVQLGYVIDLRNQ